MLKTKDYFKLLIILVAVFVGTNLAAQDLSDAKNLAREGKTALDAGQFDVAVIKMEQSIDICKDLWDEEEDEEAEAMMKKLQQMMPNLYLQAGLVLANAGEFDEAVNTLEKCNRTSSSMNMADVEAKSKGLISQIYLKLAGDAYNEAIDEATSQDKVPALLKTALDNVTKSLANDPTSLDGYKLKVLVELELEDDAGLAETARALQSVNGKVMEKNDIIQMVSNYFYNVGLKAKQSTNYDVAIEKLNLCLEFDKENCDAYYLLAFIYNEKKEWDKTIAVATEALTYEKPDKQDRFYYELGTAYYQTGDKASACDSYSKVATGKYFERAQYEMKQVVKCE